ncbi:MAG: hypothetical protein O7G88_13930 [bacterium]|nr:hypothetical protein [bacterium]
MDKKRCLILLPIGVTRRQEGPTFLAIYKHVLIPALQAIDIPLSIFRGDEVMRSGMTLYEGGQWLQNPHLVIADLTTTHSGVVHDLDLRKSLADRTILLCQQMADIPPRFAHYRQILYTFSEHSLDPFHQELAAHVHDILRPTPPDIGAIDTSQRQ